LSIIFFGNEYKDEQLYNSSELMHLPLLDQTLQNGNEIHRVGGKERKESVDKRFFFLNSWVLGCLSHKNPKILSPRCSFISRE